MDMAYEESMMREKDGKYNHASGSKDYRWLESQIAQALNKKIDGRLFDRLTDEPTVNISKCGDVPYEESMMREKETAEMCEICRRGITFIPKDLVVRGFRDTEWDCEKNTPYWYDGLQMGKVIAVSSEHGTVQVEWGTISDTLQAETEWCWPSDFKARIRNGKYETIVELWNNPS